MDRGWGHNNVNVLNATNCTCTNGENGQLYVHILPHKRLGNKQVHRNQSSKNSNKTLTSTRAQDMIRKFTKEETMNKQVKACLRPKLSKMQIKMTQC